MTATYEDLAERCRHIRLLKVLGHDRSVNALCFSPDSRLLATGGYDPNIQLWDGSTGRRVRRIDSHASFVLAVAFSPGGQLLASGAIDGTVRSWDAATASEVRRLLASASDGTAKLWDLSALELGDKPFSPGRTPEAADGERPLLAHLRSRLPVPGVRT